MGDARVLPEGTVTFLFTDIEQSTRAAERLGDEDWAEVLAAHRRILRPLFVRFHGVEVGTDGDAFFVAFARAGDAVSAAVEAQRALNDHEIRVRIGVHTGEALVRDGDYVGHEVHRAKRVSDAGHGGQIVVSQTTADLVGTTHSLIDLGLHRLKDLDEPQRLFQVVAGGIGAQFPPPRSLGSSANNLPLVRSSFVGRREQIAAVHKLVENNRLVTLTGIGGCGKTRLALQVAAEQVDRHPNGVCFVELGPVTSPDAVPPALAAAVGLPVAGEVRVGPSSATLDAVIGFLAKRACLLVLDNCEHLIDACADAVDGIQQRCPGVVVLTTSRELLGVDGEQAVAVPSLTLPAGGEVESEAVTLFVERARGVRPDFVLSADNADVIAEICRRVDGIPLAIEFAAARVSHLSPQQIARKLDDRFRLLTGGRRHVQRQQTLQATLDWSYDLASERERILLRRLAVFPGSFSLAAAEGICSGGAVQPSEVTDLVGSLVAKSFVEVDPCGAETRYRLLETVRAYGSERLAHAGEADSVRNRHRDWFLAFAEAIPWEERFGRTADVLLPEIANIRAVLDLTEAQGRPDLFLRLVAGTWSLWMRGHATPDDYRRFAQLGTPTVSSLSPDLRAIVLLGASLVAQLELDFAAGLALADRAVDAARDAHPALLATTLSNVGFFRSVLSAFTGDEAQSDHARQDIAEALALSAWDYPDVANMAIHMVASHEMMRDNVAGAIDVIDAHLGPLAAGAYGVFDVRSILAVCLHVEGEFERANELVDQVLAAHHAQPDSSTRVFRRWLAPVRATRSVHDAVELLRVGYEERDLSGIPGALEEWVNDAANVLVEMRDSEAAARLLGWIHAQTFGRGVAQRSPAMYILYRSSVRRARGALAPELATRSRLDGAAMDAEQAVATVFDALARVSR